jgi:hypothetical protein
LIGASVRGRSAELSARIVGVEIDCALGQPQDLRDLASASLVAPFDYTSMIWALVLGYAMFGETPTSAIVLGSAIIAAAGLFVIWRERQLGMMRRREIPAPAANPRGYDPPNALKVMMVRVSAIPGMVWTFSAMKWPMSVEGST